MLKKETFKIMSSESDSDSPEDVSFSLGKSTALEVIKTAKEQISQGKEKQREKRRQRDMQYSQQKKKKLERLAETKLSDDFLDNLPDEPLFSAEKEDRLLSLSMDNEDIDDVDSHQDDDTPDDVNPVGGGWNKGEEFIPLNMYGGIQVVSVNEESKKAKSSAQRAKEFKQNLLYKGSIPRETVQSKRSMVMKRKARRKSQR